MLPPQKKYGDPAEEIRDPNPIWGTPSYARVDIGWRVAILFLSVMKNRSNTMPYCRAG